MARDREIDLVDDEGEEDELEELIEDEVAGSVTGFFAGLVIGTFLGAGIALVLAPERGDVTRRKIRKRIYDLGEDARERIDDLRDEAGRELKVQRRKLRRRFKGRH